MHDQQIPEVASDATPPVELRSMTVHRAFRWGIRALTVLISAVAAFGIGYGTANERFGFGQPGIVALVLGAAVAGAAVSNLPFAALLGVVVGYAGSAGIIQRLSPEQPSG